MSIVFSQLPQLTPGKIITFGVDMPISHLVVDSRQAFSVSHALFFAIKGKSHDGHTYVQSLYATGVRQFVVDELNGLELEGLKDANIFLADNVIAALQDIAAYHRSRFSMETIAITGSNGKTIVKEWLYQLLSPSFSVVKSPKSYNSQVGVPLSVWQIQEGHSLGIFEAGISKVGEMERLEKIIQPTLGVFTNIGPAHAEGFASLKEKIKEKSMLFTNCGRVVYCKDHHEITLCLERNFGKEKLVSWSHQSERADYVFKELKQTPKGTSVMLCKKAEKVHLFLPFRDPASLENVFHCMVVMSELGISLASIQQRVSSLVNVPMRLELKQGKGGSYIIDDTYNNDIEGLRVALQFMQQQPLKGKKMVILSDMLESGIPHADLYRQVYALLQEHSIEHFIGVGQVLSSFKALFPQGSNFFADTEELISHLPELQLAGALILVKGARQFHFEKIVQNLAQKIHRTILEVNLNSLAYNLQVFRQMVRPETKMMVMVKAFAYGSGSHEVAHLLQYHKVDYLAVAYTDEGVELRESNITLPIMVMNPTPEEFDKLLKYDLEPEIYSFNLLQSLVSYIQKMEEGQHFPSLHLAIDTGMHRLGFEEQDISSLLDILQKSSLKIASVFSHLVGIDEPEHDVFSKRQALVFEGISKRIEEGLGYKVIKHLLNSAGITRFAAYQMDMVRLGIGLYGIENKDHPQDKKLQNVGTLKTLVSQLRYVKKGESVGYSRKGMLERDSKIATLAIGYADGYSRAFGNGRGKVWINGHLAPIVGNVCMDMCMADVTDIEVEEGDEAVIFGAQLPPTEVAKWAQTIPYEILTNVSERIKRVFYMD